MFATPAATRNVSNDSTCRACNVYILWHGPRMVRRTKVEAAATREALLDAALGVFRDRGVAHTSLEEVAASAGVTRGAVYWHFKDKADLSPALGKRVRLPMETMVVFAGETPHDDPLGALRALAVNCL